MIRSSNETGISSVTELFTLESEGSSNQHCPKHFSSSQTWAGLQEELEMVGIKRLWVLRGGAVGWGWAEGRGITQASWVELQCTGPSDSRGSLLSSGPWWSGTTACPWRHASDEWERHQTSTKGQLKCAQGTLWLDEHQFKSIQNSICFICATVKGTATQDSGLFDFDFDFDLFRQKSPLYLEKLLPFRNLVDAHVLYRCCFVRNYFGRSSEDHRRWLRWNPCLEPLQHITLHNTWTCYIIIKSYILSNGNGVLEGKASSQPHIQLSVLNIIL